MKRAMNRNSKQQKQCKVFSLARASKFITPVILYPTTNKHQTVHDFISSSDAETKKYKKE